MGNADRRHHPSGRVRLASPALAGFLPTAISRFTLCGLALTTRIGMGKSRHEDSSHAERPGTGALIIETTEGEVDAAACEVHGARCTRSSSTKNFGRSTDRERLTP
jgi:hypothetical protein